MKPLLWILTLSAWTLLAADVAPPAEKPDQAPPETGTNIVAVQPEPSTAVGKSTAEAGKQPVVDPSDAVTNLGDTNLLRLNFRGAPLELVLDYLSEAAGFIINLHATPRGRVDVWSSTPVTKEEALALLDSVLRKNGYAAIRNGRTLTIVNRDEAKVFDIPVKLGSDPESIPRNDEIVTQIIPVRYVEVMQLTKDIQPLVSSQTVITANEAGNSIVITDTQANIRRVAEIVRAIDMGAEDVTEVRVFRLQNSDPTEISDLLTSLFPDESRGSGGSQSPVQFGGFRGFFGRSSGSSSSSAASGSQNQRIRKRARVLAVPDPRTSSVVVSAAKDLMGQIEAVVQELDSNKDRKQAVHVYQLQNADPEEVQQVLQDMFERNSTTGSRNQNRSSSSLSNRRTSQNNQATTRTGNSRMQSGRTGIGN